MAGTEQDDEVANCSERLNKGAMVKNLIPQQFSRRQCPKTTVKSRGTVEKTGHRDEECCNGSALPRHDPTKESVMILEMLFPKPGGHVLSPEFDRVRGGPRLR
jgi:hypothetical protein